MAASKLGTHLPPLTILTNLVFIPIASVCWLIYPQSSILPPPHYKLDSANKKKKKDRGDGEEYLDAA